MRFHPIFALIQTAATSSGKVPGIDHNQVLAALQNLALVTEVAGGASQQEAQIARPAAVVSERELDRLFGVVSEPRDLRHQVGEAAENLTRERWLMVRFASGSGRVAGAGCGLDG